MATKKQRDLNKLKAYAKALGLKVVFKKGTRTDAGATWDTNLVLTFFNRKNDSQKKLILNFIHEIAHHAMWIAEDKIHDDMLYDALNIEDSRIGEHEPKVDKSMRKLIYEDEFKASTYREGIRKQLDLESVSQYDVELDVKLDLWIYRYYHIHGEFPTIEQSSKQKRKFKK